MDRKRLDDLIVALETQIQDNPTINQLIDGRQFTPAQLEFAILSACDRMEATPPPITFSCERYPFTFIVRGAIVNLMETVEIIDTRNSLTYNDSGLNVKDTHEEKYGMLARNYYQMFTKELQQFKVSKNIMLSMTPMRGV